MTGVRNAADKKWLSSLPDLFVSITYGIEYRLNYTILVAFLRYNELIADDVYIGIDILCKCKSLNNWMLILIFNYVACYSSVNQV